MREPQTARQASRRLRPEGCEKGGKSGVSSCISDLSDTDGVEFNLTRPRVVVFATLITAACKDGTGKLLRKRLSLGLYVRFCWTCELRPLRIHHSDALVPQSGTRQGRKSRRRSSEHARLTSRLTVTAAPFRTNDPKRRADHRESCKTRETTSPLTRVSAPYACSACDRATPSAPCHTRESLTTRLV